MAKLIENKEEIEKVILVAVSLDDSNDADESLDELEELVNTAGAQVVGRTIQNREAVHPGTYVGKGKVEELKDLIWETQATAIVCDDELTPAQYKNLEDELNVKVMDRTLIILDIFAGRAKTAEGKIQVELAQLRYRSSRLIGMKNLSRQGAGIGTRGPGEKKLEVIQPHKAAAEQTLAHVVVGEGIINADHGQIIEHQKERDAGNHHHQQHGILFGVITKIAEKPSLSQPVFLGTHISTSLSVHLIIVKVLLRF